MLIKTKRGWKIPESAATPEHVFWNRRTFMGAAAGLGAILAAPRLSIAADTDPSAPLYPVKRSPRFTLDRPVTAAELTTQYNNYYEFGSHKHIAEYAQALPIRPWVLTIDGMVEKPFQIGIDDLLKRMPLEERLYRHRCVERWAMAVPWSGFALKELVALAKPLSGAKYVRFESFNKPEVAESQLQDWYPWPYVEGLTLEEATNDLSFMVTGMYGKPVPKQNGAPLRLALPWKYGFKSAKGIVKVSFTADRPQSFWQNVDGAEYGFWANINPDVPHARWSQAEEQVLGEKDIRPTKLFNGYGEYVAALYKNMQGEDLYH
ncbi:MAG TPA: protein-methionine-sulfoxide reductase catalytic subunit MsrP [Dongiaceae bacterium]|jgi:sulfoxide reductase catalytic subunit YedY|nr:protein-methionine-sulfoxide reductase catalytic subunit MsrP [Dongiaceae bacterium]